MTLVTYIHTYIHTYYTFIHNIYIHTYMHTYIYTYIHTYIYVHTCTYIHTYIHTYIYWTPLRAFQANLYTYIKALIDENIRGKKYKFVVKFQSSLVGMVRSNNCHPLPEVSLATSFSLSSFYGKSKPLGQE